MADASSAAAVDLAVDRVTDFAYVAGSERIDTETTYAGVPVVPRTTDYDYDDIGRLEVVTDPEGNTDTRTYTVHSQVETRTIHEPPLADRSYTYTYDDLGRRTVEVTDGSPAHTTITDYDALGRRTRIIDPARVATDYEYNAFSDQTWLIEDARSAAPRQTESQYNQLGYLALQRTWDGQGLTETTTYETDSLGRRTRIDFCDGGAWVYEYDDAGRMNVRTDPRGQVTTFSHNWRGQVLTKHVDSSLVEAFDYTPLGWMTLAERDANNRATFAHDDFGQVTDETQVVAGVGATLTHEYNQVGERTLLVYPASVGLTLGYGRDGLGQVTAIERGGAPLAAYEYAGRFMTDRAVRTTSATETWIRYHADHDVHRRVETITNSADVDGVVTELDRYEYTFDKVGNRLTADVSGDPAIADAVGYDYDDFNRLTSATYDSDTSTEVFDYDLLGNRLSYADRSATTTTYDHNCVNEYTDITPGALDPQHDVAGNLTRTETGYELAYDYEQRLVEVRDPGSTVLATYTYDALGRRVTEMRDGDTTRFTYDGGTDGSGHRVLAESDLGGALRRYYVEGPTYVDEHLVLGVATGSAAGEYAYLTGALHTVTGLVDAGGAAVVRYAYDAYGLPTTYAASTPCNPCDANCDGFVTPADIDPFVQILTGQLSPCSWCAGDANCDGQVTSADIDYFVECVAGGGGTLCDPLAGALAAENPYHFTGRRLDHDLRDAAGSVTGQGVEPVSHGGTDWDGRPLLVLYHYRARAYDPFHGRFCQRDPALYAESLNLYQYALSNPATRLDPGGRFSLIDVLSTTNVGLRIYGMADTAVTARQPVEDFASGVSVRNQMLGILVGMVVDKAGGKALDALVDIAGPALKRIAARFGKGWRKSTSEISELRAKAQSRPLQRHHGVPRGGKKWGPKYEEILEEYDLGILDDWNVRTMPHLGRHPDEYSRWIYEHLQNAHRIAKGDQGVFLAYMKDVLDLVERSPEMPLKEWWR
jgi:RHS repeat-associated protein